MSAERAVNPGDIFAAILHYYPDKTFENDREKLHSAFYEIRTKHFDLLRDFVFKNNVLFPRSRVLDEVLASLQPGFLGKNNPTFQVYQIKKDKLELLWNKELKASFQGHDEEIKEVANELKTLLS